MLFDREGWLVVVEESAEVATAIEANDVEAGEYVGLDAHGRVLELSVRYESEQSAWRSAQEVSVSPSGDRVELDELRALLAEALGDADERTPLSELLRAAQRKPRLELKASETSALLRQRVAPG